MDRPLVIRRARGYAPLPVVMEKDGPNVLAVGGHLKNTVALNVKNNVFISQHIGDLQTEQSLKAFHRAVMNLQGLYATLPAYIACDLHPDYLSTKFAENAKLPLIKVQHHHAHIVSCMAENRLDATVLGISWDGTGYGLDGTVWGGEFLKSTLKDYERVAYLKSFMLPGGDKAAMEPRRTAAAILYELAGGDWKEFRDLPTIRSFSPAELKVIKDMMDKRVNAPVTTSMGRLFDAVASLLDIKQTLRFEGQAAMGLEYVLEGAKTEACYDFTIDQNPNGSLILNWTTTVQGLIKDIRRRTAARKISAKFHNTLVEMAVDIAKRIGEEKVVLSGGCFQNKYLTERMVRRLTEEGFKPYWHQLVPPNDGGISLGQAVCAINKGKKFAS
jgi:hydrogenase maturation protein HypF